MNVPVRPAPAPPSQQSVQNGNDLFFDWNEGTNNFLFNKTINSNPREFTVKKKPPPRPPPPKIKAKNQQKQVSSRSSDIFGFWSRQTIPFVKHKSNEKEQTVLNTIRYQSHPSNQSGSDGLSVNSCGSDSSYTNNIASVSIFENGFEDDFDFFGSSLDKAEQVDPFSSPDVLDPFFPVPNKLTHSSTFPVEKTSSSSSWFEELGKVLDPTPLQPQSKLRPQSSSSSFPTIIRAKPNRPPAPPTTIFQNFAGAQNNLLATKIDNEEIGDFDDLSDWEPPMPTIPPPPPPPEAFQEFGLDMDETKCCSLEVMPAELNEPYAIALYDYETEHADDLSFKANDVIILMKKVNSEWLYGQSNGRQGMFPSNFVNIVKPLENFETFVKTLYAFSAETSEDLSFPEGVSIKVTGRVNSDWLIGEYQGRKGQFPASFVDHIPLGLESH